MKKFIFALAALTATAFVACSKDDDPTDELTDTVWTFAQNDLNGQLAFKAGGIAVADLIYDDEKMHLSGTYTYQAPTINIAFPRANITAVGTIDGDRMEVRVSGVESFLLTLHKTGDPDDSSSEVLFVKQIKISKTWKGETETETYTLDYDSQNRVTALKYNNYTVATASYSADQIKVTFDNSTTTLKLNADGHVQTVIDDYDYPIDLTYENGYLMCIGDDEKVVKYTWKEGNLVSAVEEHRRENGIDISYTTCTYDTSRTLVPTNIDLAYLTKTIMLLYEDDNLFIPLALYGKQCASPLTQLKATDDDGSIYIANYAWEFNGDGSVAKITITDNNLDYKKTFELFY